MDKKLVSLYINILTKKGKKQTSEVIMLKMAKEMKKSLKRQFSSLFPEIVENSRPYIGLLNKRVGTNNYQIPVPIKEEREIFFAIKWGVSTAYMRKTKNKKKELKKELLLVMKKEGKISKKKQYLYSLAKKNRAYIKYL